MPLQMLMTNTQVSRNTKALVMRVEKCALHHPTTIGAIFKAINEIVEEVVTILQMPPERRLDRNKSNKELASSKKCGPHFVIKTNFVIKLEELVEMIKDSYKALVGVINLLTLLEKPCQNQQKLEKKKVFIVFVDLDVLTWTILNKKGLIQLSILTLLCWSKT